jgi:hypothetical protein
LVPLDLCERLVPLDLW